MSRPLWAALLALAACSPTPTLDDWDAVPRPADHQPPPGSQGLSLTGPSLVLPGSPQIWEVRGDVLQPGDTVYLAWGSTQAPGPCPFRRQLGGTLCMDIDDPPRPVTLATAIDDPDDPGNAVAQLAVAVPPSRLGSVYLQALSYAGARSATTNVVSVTLDRTRLCLGDDATGDADGDGICGDLDLCEGDDATGDPDGDGVCDDLDPCPVDNPDDLDGDGVCASDEVCLGDDATGDTDGDGVCDSNDRCPADFPDDQDGDWLCDSDDACPLDRDNDADGDGVCGDVDVCLGDDATGDTDGDGTCDDLDPCPTDDDCDNDGLSDDVDPCPTQADCDGDGVDDNLDECPLDPLDDVDRDGICDTDDVCLGFDDSIDADGDKIPDGCDLCTDTQWSCEGGAPLPTGTIWHVSVAGDDTTADGTAGRPFRTLEPAVDAAASGDGIYFMPGEHQLPAWQSGTIGSGIIDKGKSLHIFGANDATVLVFDGASSTARDGNPVYLTGTDSVLSNLVLQYAPTRNVNYSDAIFRSPGTNVEVHNVVFENVSPTRDWSYTYDNSNKAAPHIYNSIFRSNGAARADYSGSARYFNCVFDVLPSRGVVSADRVVRATTPSDFWPATLGDDLRHTGATDVRNPGLARSHMGVAGGLYAWDTDCPPDPTASDLDGDNHPDACDDCPADPFGDVDLDGVCDADDACPLDNPNDPDGDGVCSSEDRCPLLADCDGDGVGDELDLCPGGDDADDEDGDGIPTACDWCVGDPLNECGTFPDEADYTDVWHVSVFGSDTFGDGSAGDPWSSVKHAIEMAASGDGIRIGPGEYDLDPMLHNVRGASMGLWDMGKDLAIWGANDQTVLRYLASREPTRRDGHAMILDGPNTVVSNLVYEFAPNRGTNYSNAVFAWTNTTASVRNIRMVNVSTTHNWALTYDNNNTGGPRVYNSAFISNGRQTSDYTGNAHYYEVQFEQTPSRGTRAYTVTRAVAPEDAWPASLPVDLENAGDPSRLNPDGTTAHIGVGGGLYAWNSNCTMADGTEDADGDGRADVCDPCPLDALGDADGDGVCGADDVCIGPDVLGDADGDRICDPYDQCLGDDATGDADFDGVCDDLDPCPLESPDDIDGDGLCASDDACPLNPDCDFDGVLDGVDLCPSDEDCDGDGVLDGADPCPVDNPDDTDGDGICDADDLCPNGDDDVDLDGDDIPDGCDFCPGDTSNSCGLYPVPTGDHLYVATFGDDGDADGTIAAPFATLAAAVTAASDGDTIELLPGRYVTPPVNTNGTKGAGIYDAGKNLTIFGANDKTILEINAADQGFSRDAHVASLQAPNTLVANLTVEFAPNRGTNYSNAIFTWCARDATVSNVVVRHTGTANWAYIYDNNYTGGPKVFNSVFISNGQTQGDYTGNPTYTNVLFDATPSRGVRQATVTRAVTPADFWNTSLPLDLRNTGYAGTNNPDGNTAHIGTGGGTYPWTTGCPYNPLAADSDGDYRPDSCDPCPDDAIGDSDGDGSCDADDLCLGDDSTGDADADGICDDLDLCDADPDNDVDGDGVCGDVDPCPLDAPDDPDGDGVCTTDDVCPLGDDALDTDGDGDPNACDVCPNDAANDCSIFPPASSYATLHYVATFGDDTTGDGTASTPFATLDAAIQAAASGDGIRILPGRYRLQPVALNGFTGAGIWDRGKGLVIYGANDQTVLEVYAADLTSTRDLHVARFDSNDTLLANLKIEYSPARSTNYSNAIFGQPANNATVRNVLFENVSTTHNWAYTYENGGVGPQVHNATFISNGRSTSNYSGSATYRSCLFDSTPSSGSRIASLTRTVTVFDHWDSSIPGDLTNAGDAADEPNYDGSTAHIGVAGGVYGWRTSCPPTVGMTDTDGDGHPDTCDVCPTDPFGDYDQDGVCDL